MKKKLIFCICLVLSIIICFSMVPSFAITYDCDVEVTSAAVLVANVETDTVVYEKNINASRYASYLSNVMTYIVARNNISDINERITITSEMLSNVRNSDNSLTKYINHSLTLKDLMHFLLMTNGVDAAYVLADHVTNGDIDAFVNLMNKKASTLGCTKTKFSSPGAIFDTTQVTTASDMYKIMKCAIETPDFVEISGTDTYMPEKYKKEELLLKNTNSTVRPDSPYYFKHIKSGKYGYNDLTKGNLAVSSYYNKVTYICIVLGADNKNEHNAFTEAKQLLTWAYTTLGNKQIISQDTVLKQVNVQTEWGSTVIGLTTSTDIYRTVPAQYDSSQLKIECEFSDEVTPPVFEGQNIGTAKLYYNDKYFEEISLISSSSCGVNMFDDLSGFAKMMYGQTLSSDNTNSSVTQPTEPATQQPQTQTPTQTSTQAVQ